MNIKESHNSDKTFSVTPLFKGELGTVAAMHIQKGERFPEHITKSPALLLCVSGEVIFEYATGQKQTLQSGDYITITPNEKHWVDALVESQLLLMK
jgi:quercetin dioxygenase-like cupin family protein